jgi:hypothetical protein
MATLDDIAADVAIIKTTVEQIYQLLYNGEDFVAQPPRPAYFKAAVDRLGALNPPSGLTLTGTLSAALTPKS